MSVLGDYVVTLHDLGVTFIVTNLFYTLDIHWFNLYNDLRELHSKVLHIYTVPTAKSQVSTFEIELLTVFRLLELSASLSLYNRFIQ